MAKFAAFQLAKPHLHQSYSSYQSSSAVTVFCDFDGPIVDVSDRYYSTYKLGLANVQAAYQTHNMALPLHVLSKEQFWQMKQERTPDPEIALRSGLRGEQIDLFLNQVKEIVNQPDLLHQDQLQFGVEWALRLLHDRGIRLVLVTLRRQNQAVQMLHRYGLHDLFEQIWGANDDDAAYLNQADHKTKLLARAIEESLLSSRGCYENQPSAWMIGDTEADIIAGQTLDIPTIALTCGIRSHSYLQRFQPTHIHHNLLSAARYLLKTKQLVA